MLAKLTQNPRPLKGDPSSRHLLVLAPAGGDPELYGAPVLKALLARRGSKFEDLAKEPVTGTLPSGALACWAAVDLAAPRFEQATRVRQALEPLLGERPGQLDIAVHGRARQRAQLADLAAYCAWLNGARLPSRKQGPAPAALAGITIHGHRQSGGFPGAAALAEGNTLARELTMLPPNELTPGAYRRRVAKLARAEGWKVETFDLKRLRRMGAGAFVAVAQGSAEADAAIVRVAYRPRGAKRGVALVGKGICFDTGGHNLKPANYMHGMHEDMNGSAVVLGTLLAASRLGVRVNIDAWLALAQNHISPTAYKQNDVVTALNGTTIEIIHTDAEGRMVLADTLTLAARAKPDLMIDYATLTGSMKVALGNRYCGAFASREPLGPLAVEAGRRSGERICLFPMDGDYDKSLDSPVADVKQCAMEGQADHILAARFLSRFAGEGPWIHVDLSAARCEGGLGAVASRVTGFGVAWTHALLEGWLKA